MSKHLQKIIKQLGYDASPCLKYRSKNYGPESMTAHTSKILSALSPFAAYMVDNEPFILFFDKPSNQDEQKELNQKIWNAQVPVVIFCSTSTIEIFNGSTIDPQSRLLDELGTYSFQGLDENSPFSFWEIRDQRFWEKYARKFSGQKLNDALLKNLTYLTAELKEKHNIRFATKLVLRLIFIRYLIDRGVDLDYKGFSCDVSTSRLALLSLLDSREKLYKLFTHLKDKFNGNLFELGDENIEQVTNQALEELKDFLSANIRVTSKQRSLFPLYDFNIIPVELISNIYEILLGKEARDKDNAFYTPKYLVDYILDKTINEHIEEHGTCKVLDPSCGSGVFLVDSYRRMIENKLQGALYTDNDNFLYDTLKNNIFGIDLNQHAIDVAIFSLYLAMLDYKNPKTLKQFRLPDLKQKNLLVCDFFDEAALLSLQETPLDFIIGNPPWGDKDGKHMDYCREHGYMEYMQKKDTCRAFILRSKDFATTNTTTCCFVLHSKMLYMQGGPSKKFRKYLLANLRIKRIIELSSVRELVFKYADAPAVVISYSFSGVPQQKNCFEYISMKKNEFFRLFNIIAVEKTDLKSVQQKLLIKNDWAWKILVYGLTGDFETICKLKATTATLEESLGNQDPPIISGTGVKYNNGQQSAHHLLGRQILDSKTAINHFVLHETKSTLFEKTKIDRPRNPALFKAPYCLLKHGPDMYDYTMKAVYSETDFVFHQAIYAMKGTSNQKAILLNAAGLLNSQIYAYFNLMLGSSLGIEREQQQPDEVLTFPFVFSGDIAEQVEKIQNIKKPKGGLFVAEEDAAGEIEILNQMILDAFDLSGNEYVDYALRIQIPRLTGKKDVDAKREANLNDYEKYGEYFHDYLSEIFARAEKHIQIKVYPSIARHYSSVEVLVLDEAPEKWLTVVDDGVDKKKILLAHLSKYQVNDLFHEVKDVLYFEEKSFCLIKANYYKNWHPAIARLDLMELTDQILSRNAKGEK